MTFLLQTYLKIIIHESDCWACQMRYGNNNIIMISDTIKRRLKSALKFKHNPSSTKILYLKFKIG